MSKLSEIRVTAAHRDPVLLKEEWRELGLKELLDNPNNFRGTHVAMTALTVIDQDPTVAVSPAMVEALRQLALQILSKEP